MLIDVIHAALKAFPISDGCQIQILNDDLCVLTPPSDVGDPVVLQRKESGVQITVKTQKASGKPGRKPVGKLTVESIARIQDMAVYTDISKLARSERRSADYIRGVLDTMEALQ